MDLDSYQNKVFVRLLAGVRGLVACGLLLLGRVGRLVLVLRVGAEEGPVGGVWLGWKTQRRKEVR